MILTILSLILLALAIACRTISELALHGKLRWSGKHTTFWGNNSWMRKYNFKGDMYNDLPPDNWYYKFFKIDYKERFPLSATMLVFLTDGYHLMQFFFFIFISLSVAFALGFTWWWWFGIWIGVHVIHAGLYKLLSR